jgi:serine/threonine protein kinase
VRHFDARSIVLKGRYTLLEKIAEDAACQTWLSTDEFASEYLVKLWPYNGNPPDYLQRALWDAELRTLYRVGSSPGADRSLVVIKDAGVDVELQSFVMALSAPGYMSLSSALRLRKDFPWLHTKDSEARKGLWEGLLLIAEGLQLLHDQNVIHRNVDAENIYLNESLGTRSFRLAGSEWSVRLGVPASIAPPANWSSPPEFFDPARLGYRLETDWFAFGMLAARCLLNLEKYGSNPPLKRLERVSKEIAQGNKADLSELERDLLARLTSPNPRDRLTKAYEIASNIDDVIRRLATSSRRETEGPLVLVLDPKNLSLVDDLAEYGFVPDTANPQDPYNPNSLTHVAQLRNFVQSDLREAQVFVVPRVNYYLLIGAKLSYRISQFEFLDKSTNTRASSWDLAFCHGTAVLRGSSGGEERVDLPDYKIVVHTRREATDRTVRQSATSWERFLPKSSEATQLKAAVGRLYSFIRCTNQIELLIRDAELFAYETVELTNTDGVDRLVLKEVPRARQMIPFLRIEGGLSEFLQREIESNKPDCKRVVLSGEDEDSLTLPHVEKDDCWQVREIDPESKLVNLERSSLGRQRPRPNPRGHLRAFGMFGQVALIRRRKKAIDRLESHSYLLRSLSSPGQVYMDTGPTQLAVPLSPLQVDEAKQAAIQDIVRVRPIYALQGPPGTGKTTLVAHLLRQLLEDDPVAQVLITAQAHGAVDVLREKVRDEAFQGIAADKLPLAVRLGNPEREESYEGSVIDVTLNILKTAQKVLTAEDYLSGIQQKWLEAVTEMIASLRTWTADKSAPDFCEVVKRGANLTYCTTSAGGLEELADLAQSFDWAIVEEAGKAHGFDLALPLQAGHRWLLIGDHKQLPPYRFKDYRDGIDHLDYVVDALEDLPERAGGLVDIDWVRNWKDSEPGDQDEFKQYARDWLTTFEHVFDYCEMAPGQETLTLTQSNGSAAGMLSGQHRMHPDIGRLISEVFYDGRLINKTIDGIGQPLRRVTHSLGGARRARYPAIVWLNTPWAEVSPLAEELGPSTGHPRYTNPFEVDALTAFLQDLRLPPGSTETEEALELAVLSPYNQQVSLINRTLRQVKLSTGIRLKEPSRSKSAADEIALRRVAHTVDSFQGNQADIICVSLVRNNQRSPGRGLGFLDESERMNVLLSRAERLLVLVGSWDFFKHQLRLVQIDAVYDTLLHWKRVLSTLESMFAEGAAMRIDAMTDLGVDT